MISNFKFLLRTFELLNSNGIQPILIGGWAAELGGIIKPRAHKDIDLIFLSENFDLVDKLLLNNHELIEISQKHKYHKRAFIFKEVMVEIFLVQKDEAGLYTNFYGTNKYYWKNLETKYINSLKVANPEFLTDFRQSYIDRHHVN